MFFLDLLSVVTVPCTLFDIQMNQQKEPQKDTQRNIKLGKVEK